MPEGLPDFRPRPTIGRTPFCQGWPSSRGTAVMILGFGANRERPENAVSYHSWPVKEAIATIVWYQTK